MDPGIFYELHFSSKMSVSGQSWKQIKSTLWYQTKNNKNSDDSDDDKQYYIPEVPSLFHMCYLICFSKQPSEVDSIVITII